MVENVRIEIYIFQKKVDNNYKLIVFLKDEKIQPTRSVLTPIRNSIFPQSTLIPK